jgi:hypothetical protein
MVWRLLYGTLAGHPLKSWYLKCFAFPVMYLNTESYPANRAGFGGKKLQYMTTQTALTSENIKGLTLDQIAYQIKANWPKVYFGAVPYLQAMATLTDMNDNYGMDSGSSIVAKIVKAELNRRLKM